MIPEWLKKELETNHALTGELLASEKLPYEIRCEIEKYYDEDRMPGYVKVTKNWILNRLNGSKWRDAIASINNCIDKIELPKSKWDELIQNKDDFVIYTLIKYYVATAQQLPPEVEQYCQMSSRQELKIEYIKYKPETQYKLIQFGKDFAKKIIHEIDAPILDAMYWWEQLGRETDLYYPPGEWMNLYQKAPRYKKLCMLEERWDVPWSIILKTYKYLPYEIKKNPFLPETVILMYRNDLDESWIRYHAQQKAKPFNERLPMLKKWTEESLKTFYEKYVKPEHDKLNNLSHYIGRLNTKKHKILELFISGVSPQNIATTLNVRPQLVYNYIRQYKIQNGGGIKNGSKND